MGSEMCIRDRHLLVWGIGSNETTIKTTYLSSHFLCAAAFHRPFVTFLPIPFLFRLEARIFNVALLGVINLGCGPVDLFQVHAGWEGFPEWYTRNGSRNGCRVFDIGLSESIGGLWFSRGIDAFLNIQTVIVFVMHRCGRRAVIQVPVCKDGGSMRRVHGDGGRER